MVLTNAGHLSIKFIINMNKAYLFFLFVYIFSCSHRKDNFHLLQKFVESRSYKYSTKVNDIPNHILLYIKQRDSTFRITDKYNMDSLCLTDDCNSQSIYNTQLNFLLYSNSEFILSYTKGGVGKYGVIDYFKNGNKEINIYQKVIPALEDTLQFFNSKLFKSLDTR